MKKLKAKRQRVKEVKFERGYKFPDHLVISTTRPPVPYLGHAW